MPHHSERRFVPYTADDMLALVVDVERYPEFLPWCAATRITSRDGDVFEADLLAAFGAFRERFKSRVVTDRAAKTITIEYLDGPFEHLTNRWHFVDEEGGCIVDFDIDFAFKSKTLEALIAGVFTRAIEKMTASFDERAHKLYASKVASADNPA